MRVPALAIALVVVACGGPKPPAEPLERPVLRSFVGVRPGTWGCIYGDCRTGAFARRVGDRVISGVVGEPSLRIEWERGRCQGWQYEGTVRGDLADGRGVLTPAQGPFISIDAELAKGEITGDATASARFSDGGIYRVTGPLRIDPPTCGVQLPSSGQIAIEELEVETASGRRTSVFRGVVQIGSNGVTPWRGAFVVDPITAGYVTRAGEAWKIGERAVCLAGDCNQGRGVEHVGGGARFDLYVGEFEQALRRGRARVHTTSPTGIREYLAEYGQGRPSRDLALLRRGYALECPGSPDLTFLPGKCTVQRGFLSMQVTWGPGGIVGLDEKLVKPEIAHMLPNMPAGLDPNVAAVASLAADVPRSPGPSNTCLICDSKHDVRIETDGPSTPIVVSIVNSVTEPDEIRHAWFPDTRVFIDAQPQELVIHSTIADHLEYTGSAELVRANGSRKPVLFRLGKRIDPLGFSTVAAYEKATPAEIAAARKRHARKAHALRVRDERLNLALRRVTAGTGSWISALAQARTALAATAADAMGWERVIRSGHAALEHGHDNVLEALHGADTAIPRLDDADPVLEPLGALNAHLRDLDDRIRLLLLAFDAFEYSDDADRLAAITGVLAADLSALPTQPIQDHLDQLRTALKEP